MRLVLIILAISMFAAPARSEAGGQEFRPGERLTARFMGVSTILLRDGETDILVDGFFSRPGLRTVLLRRLRPNPTRIHHALHRAEAGTFTAILVAHAHYDHAMDSAVIAGLSSDTQLIGSRSVANIARGHRLPETQSLTTMATCYVAGNSRSRFWRHLTARTCCCDR